MSGLSYVGKAAANPTDLAPRGVLTAQLAAVTPNQTTVQAEINAQAGGTYALKTYVDSQDGTFQLLTYYQAQDLLNIPQTVVGTVAGSAITGSYYGVASLDNTGKIPSAQLPVVGAGYLEGGWGTTATATGTTGATPLKIADWNLGVAGIQFQPWVFLSAFVTGTNAHPIIELRIANSVTAPTYSGSTLIGQGLGRAYYNDYHAITALTAPSATSETPTMLSSAYNVWITAWLYDLNASTVTLSTGGIASAAVYYWRLAQ